MTDFRYAIRTLAKNPGFTAVAVLVLAVGIGGNSAMFTLINALVLRPLPAANPDQIVGCYSKSTKPSGSYRSVSYPNYRDLREGNTVFSGLLAHTMAMVGHTEGDLTRRAFAAVVSANYFSIFGVRLAAGRDFLPEEEQPGSAKPVVIVSYDYWKASGLDRGFIGKAIRLNGRLFTVIGVAPADFTGTTAIFAPEFWLPLGAYELAANDYTNEQKRRLEERGNHCLMLVGRLKQGISMAAAQTQLETLGRQMEQAFPAENKEHTFVVARLPRLSISPNPNSGENTKPLVVVLLSMSGVVLLIACLNLANILLARGSARRKEIAIRLAMGGGRSRIIRQLLAEGLLLALAGSVAGLLPAYWAIDALIASLGPKLPFIGIVFPNSPDWRILVATAGFCMIATLIFAFGPAWKLSRPDVMSDLKEQMGNIAPVRRRRGLFAGRNLLVEAQIALSLALLAAAGHFTSGAIKAAQASPGFPMDSGILVESDASLAGYDEARGRAVYRTVLERLRGLPGVESASLSYVMPFGLFQDGRDVRPAGGSGAIASDGKDSTGDKPIGAGFNIIGTDYFKTLGLPLLRGREFERLEVESESSARVAIIDEPLARKLWPNEDALGRFIDFGGPRDGKPAEVMEIVGVVPGVKNDLSDKTPRPHVYVPFGQHFRFGINFHLKVADRRPGVEAGLLKAVRQEILAVDSRLPVLSITTLRKFHSNGAMLWFVRTGALLFSIFGGLAAFLAVVGVYGVRAYGVARRMREIGIRLALGATRRDVLWMLLREGALLTAVGSVIGLLLALAAGRLLSSMLYEVSAGDPMILGSSVILLAGAALLACYFPARRAAKADPMVALRHE